MLATRDVLGQPRDGYNLLLCTHFESINVAVYKNPQFKLGDLAPISLIAKYYYGLALANAIPADDFAAFVQYAKDASRRGQLRHHRRRLGAGDPGAPAREARRHLHEPHSVPRRPAGGAGADRRRVHFYVSPTLAIAPQYQEKLLKILAVSAPERLQEPAGDSDPQRAGASTSCASAGSASAPAPARRSRSSISCSAMSRRSSTRPNTAPDREGRLDPGVVDPGRAAASDHADARRGRGEHPRVRDAASSERHAKADRNTEETMTMSMMTRRHSDGGRRRRAGGGARARPRPAAALETIRQGYQTNIWGMPTYYLLKSGALEKRGIKFEEFAVPSGNLTMQQMVARQVDMGTYAGQSFIIGHDKGGLVAIALIEYVGKTAQIVTRKDLNITKVERAQGQEGRQPDRLLGRQHLRGHRRAERRPQEGRLPGGAHERQRHGRGDGRQDRGRHGQRRALQRDRGGRGHRHLDHGLLQRRPDAGVHGGDARLRRQEPDTVVAYLKAWQEVARDFKDNPARSPT